jgi:hypothetical protein
MKWLVVAFRVKCISLIVVGLWEETDRIVVFDGISAAGVGQAGTGKWKHGKEIAFREKE